MRAHIDAMEERAGWNVQSKNKIDFSVGAGSPFVNTRPMLAPPTIIEYLRMRGY